MIILGLLFILFVALVGTWFYLALADLAGGGPANDLSAMGITIGLSPAALLLTGFASALALAMGLYLIKAGLSSSARRRRERKDLERTAAESQRAADAAAAERLRTEKAAPVEPAAPSPNRCVTPRRAGHPATGVAVSTHRSSADGERKRPKGQRPSSAYSGKRVSMAASISRTWAIRSSS